MNVNTHPTLACAMLAMAPTDTLNKGVNMAYLDAVEDAAAIGDLSDKLDRGFEIALNAITKLITEVLTKSITQAPYQSLSLPFISYRNGPSGKVEQYPVAEMVADYCSAGPVHVALMEVIAGSTCPLVAKLRQALVDAHTNAHAEEYAEFTS
jgi:hypothetical protein